MDNKTTTQAPKQDVIVRTKNGMFILPWKETNLENAKKISSENGIYNQFIFSNSGQYILIQEKEKVFSLDLDTNKLIGQIAGANFQSINLSPMNKYALVLEKVQTDLFNLHLLSFPQLEILDTQKLTQVKKKLWPFYRFSHQDQFILRIDNNELKIIDPVTFNVVETYDSGVCEYLSVQPGQLNTFQVVCYQPKKELNSTSSGLLKIFHHKKSGKAIFEKSVPEASDIEIKWSPNGSSMLMIKSSSEDASNQSYYGETQVYLFDQNKRDFICLPTYEGPVHSVQWSSDSEYFAIVSGFMPSGAVLFSKDGKPKFEFGKDHKNTLHWSPLKRFLLICGFGNLDGAIEIWDTIQYKTVGKCKQKSASICLWSQCGRKFLTAKVTPRLNVDNQYTIIDYQGNELIKHSFAQTELYDVQFRPSPLGTFQDRPPSPVRKSQQQQEQPQKKFFVPIGGGGELAQQMRLQKATEGARVLDQHENFGNRQSTGWGLERINKPQGNFPPGYVPTEEKKEKKKRVRHRKNNQEDDDEK